MSRLTSREVVLQREVRGTSFSLELSEEERLLLARFVYCLAYSSSPIHDVLKPLYLRPGYNRAELSVDRELWPSVFGGVYGSNEASTQRELSGLHGKLANAERLLEHLRQRIEDLIAQNAVLRAEMGQQGEALSRFQMEAPTSEPGNPSDDHVEAPRKWKVQYSNDGLYWFDYGDDHPASNLTRSAAYRWMRDRNLHLSVGRYPRRVVPQDTPAGVEPDRGYYTVQHLKRGQWVPTWTCPTSPGAIPLGSKGHTRTFNNVEDAKEYCRDNWGWLKPSDYRVKWYRNNA